jgi:glycosyltransferase involved in cell wall biosynthesis
MTIRIAFISGYFGIGGMERTFLTLAENLDSQEYSFYFINLADNRFQDRFTLCGACFHSPDYNDVIDYIKKNKIDIVLTCNSDEGSYLGYLAKVTCVIERPDGYSMAFYTDKKPVNAIIASTDRVYDTVKSLYPEKYSTLIYNGVDLSIFNRTYKNDACRVKYAIPDDAVVIGHIGRIAFTKCLDKLIDVFAGIAQRHTCVYLLIAGDEFPHQCGCRNDLLLHAQKLGVSDRVVLLQANEYPEHLFELCDIAVLASGSYRLPDGTCEVEGIPNSVMEAMAMKLPVVATDSGETGLLVEHEKSGFIVGVTDWNAFSANLEKLIVDPSLRIAMGEYGRKIIERSFSRDSMVKAYDKVFRLVLDGSFSEQYPDSCAKAEQHFLAHPFRWENEAIGSSRILVIRSGNKYLFDKVVTEVSKKLSEPKLYALCTERNRQDMDKYDSIFEGLFVCGHPDGFSIDTMNDIIETANTLSLDYVICLYNDLLGKQYDNVRALVNRIQSKNKLIANKLGRFFRYMP